MITENGIVTRTDTAMAWVQSVRGASCEGCSTRGLCEASKECEVEAINSLGAKVGDTVVVGYRPGSLIKISMLLYLFPVISMIFGAVFGTRIAPNYGMDESALSAFFAFLCFFISFLCIRLAGNRLALNQNYRARIIRIKSRA